jgi:putative transposase
MSEFKGCHFPREVILWLVRWSVAYPLSYRMLEEIAEERGIEIDHATIQRWVVKFSPILLKNFWPRKRPVGKSWRMDETYIRLKGEWVYLYRAVDKEGQTIDCLLRKHRDKIAAEAFFEKAFAHQGIPLKVTIDGSASNKAALEQWNSTHTADGDPPLLQIRQEKYLNNLIEQDHRFIKRKTRPMLGFKSFSSAQATLDGIELMHMLRKNQMMCPAGSTPAQNFYALLHA